MVNRQGPAHAVCRQLGWKLMASAAIIVLATGCTKTSKKDGPQKRLAAINYSKQSQRAALKPNHPLHIETTKWARKHQKNPSDAAAALNYARNLKALGAKDRAFEVLARTHQLQPGNGELTSEYGRLALDLGKVQMADQLLNRALKSRGNPDWRLLSALGTVQAKRGDHKKAQSYYLAALKRQPGATSVYNNLALSYALDGKAGDAENLLKQAVSKGHNTQVVRQNLALVLGLQSKFDEAEKVAKTDLDNNRIDNNVSYLRKMVKTTKPATTKTARAGNKTPVKTVKADTLTTAAIPGKTAARPAKRAPAKATPAKTTRQPAPSTTPVRKPEAPSVVAKSITRTLSKEQKAEMARPLPWSKPPAKTKPSATTVASLQPKAQKAAAAPSWSVTVKEPAVTTAQAAPASRKEFAFPVAD